MGFLSSPNNPSGLNVRVPGRAHFVPIAWALDCGASWAATCGCVDPFVVPDEVHEDMPARCLRCGRTEPADPGATLSLNG